MIVYRCSGRDALMLTFRFEVRASPRVSPLRATRRAAIVIAEAGGGRLPRATATEERAAMSVRIGFDHYTIGHRALSPEATLDFAREHGLDGVQFLEPASIDPALEPSRLSAFRR